MAQLARVAPNPPKEEGGGDLLHPGAIMRAGMLQRNEDQGVFAAFMQDTDLKRYLLILRF
jgi:hypothetical protein